MTTGWIGIGSNVGERTTFARRAVEALKGSENVEVTGVSSIYETSPIGGPPQRSYVNLAVRIETELGPRELLDLCQSIERKLGRDESAIRWGPRVIDLDILQLGDEKVVEPDLEIPHPRLRERRFVLVPLLEVDPGAADPWGARYADVLDEAQGDVALLEPF